MKNIDFLPESYRRRRMQRRAYAWEIGVIALFGAVVGVTATVQFIDRWRVGSQLTALDGGFQRALETQATYQGLQAQLATASEAAGLYAYLEHPWPRTQVLRAILGCMPPNFTLSDLHITYEALPTTPAPAPDEAELKKLSPARRDLDRLRRDADRRATIVWIEGLTDDAANVYQFAHKLGLTPPFASVKLETVENQGERGLRRTSFRLRGLLKPGYGQPGGPQPAAKVATSRFVEDSPSARTQP